MVAIAVAMSRLLFMGVVRGMEGTLFCIMSCRRMDGSRWKLNCELKSIALRMGGDQGVAATEGSNAGFMRMLLDPRSQDNP